MLNEREATCASAVPLLADDGLRRERVASADDARCEDGDERNATKIELCARSDASEKANNQEAHDEARRQLYPAGSGGQHDEAAFGDGIDGAR